MDADEEKVNFFFRLYDHRRVNTFDQNPMQNQSFVVDIDNLLIIGWLLNVY